MKQELLAWNHRLANKYIELLDNHHFELLSSASDHQGGRNFFHLLKGAAKNQTVYILFNNQTVCRDDLMHIY